MNKIFLLVITSLASLSALAKEHQPSLEEISRFYTKCLYENIGVSCHNLGAHFARNIKDETVALFYYEKACKLNYRDSCANIGNIKVKYSKSRALGLKILKRECQLYREPSPCLLFDVVNSNKNKPWLEIFKKYSERYKEWKRLFIKINAHLEFSKNYLRSNAGSILNS